MRCGEVRARVLAIAGASERGSQTELDTGQSASVRTEATREDTRRQEPVLPSTTPLLVNTQQERSSPAQAGSPSAGMHSSDGSTRSIRSVSSDLSKRSAAAHSRANAGSPCGAFLADVGLFSLGGDRDVRRPLADIDPNRGSNVVKCSGETRFPEKTTLFHPRRPDYQNSGGFGAVKKCQYGVFNPAQRSSAVRV